MFWSTKDLLKRIELLSIAMHKHGKENDSRLDRIEKVLIKQEENLKEHMRRSDNLEEVVTHLKDNEIKKINKHVYMVEGMFKLVGLLGIVASIIGGIGKLLGLI